MNDAQLIREFVEQRSDRAFRSLVERHLPLVLGTARRITQSNALAEEIAQAVFILLARKAPGLGSGTLLPGWLHRTTRFVAARAVEAEVRRRRREETAAIMHLDSRTEDSAWALIAPDLDLALSQLNETDRHAVLLRYLEQRSLREVGAALGIGEEAAKKRTGRALEKLRQWFQRRGRNVTVAALVAGLTEEATISATGSALADLAARIADSVMTKATSSATAGAGLAEQVWVAWQWARIKLGAVIGIGAVTGALLVSSGLGWLQSGDEAGIPVQSVAEAVVAAAGPDGGAEVGGAVSAATVLDGSGPGGPALALRLLEVTVLAEATGDPVHSASATHSLLALTGQERPRMRADSNGVIRLRVPERLPGAERMDQFSVWVRATNFAPRKIHWISTTGQVISLIGTQHTVRLSPGITLSGVVVDEAGQGMPGVQVGVSASNYRGYTIGQAERRVEEYSEYSIDVDDLGPDRVVTDRNGRFAFSQYPSDLRSLEIKLRSNDGSRHRYRTPPRDELPPDDAVPVSFDDLASGSARLLIPRGHLVAGRVLTAEGEPIRGASVAEGIQWGNLRILSRVDTDFFGQFSLSNRPAREFILVASAPGFATASTVVQAGPDLAPVIFRLPRALALRGRVGGPQGEGLPEVMISVPDVANPGTGFEWNGRTDADGRFVWEDAPTNEVVMGFASAQFGFRQFRLRAGNDNVVTLGGGSPDLVRIHGRVTDAKSGVPIEQFSVAVSYDPTLPPGGGLPTAGEKGEFAAEVRLDAVPVGYFPQWRVSVSAAGYEPFSSRFYQFEDGDQRLDLALEPGGTMRFRLSGPSGEEVHSAEMAFAATRPVWSHNPGELNGQRETADATGIFTLDRPIGARAIVVFHRDGWLVAPARSGAEIRELALRPWGRIEGTVFSGGTPLSGETIVLNDLVWDSSGQLQVLRNATTDAEGRFTFSKLPAGEFLIARTPASANSLGEPSVRVGQVTVALQAGQSESVELTTTGAHVKARLLPPASLSGSLLVWTNTVATLSADVTMPSRPIRANFVREEAHTAAMREYAHSPAVLAAARRQRSALGRVDATGSVSFEDIPPGRYVLEAKLYAAPAVRTGETPIEKRVVRARLKTTVFVPEVRSTTADAAEVAGAIELGAFSMESQ